MPKLKPKPSKAFLAEIGQITILWNEVESLVKGLLILFVHDPIAPVTMAAGMNIATLINVVRTLAFEYDAQEHRTYKAIPIRKDIRKRKGDDISPHVDHALSYADRIREYRNYFIHCLQWSSENSHFSAHSISAKGRLKTHQAIVTLSELKTLTYELRTCIRYFDAIIKAISQQKAYIHFHSARRPAWPKPPALPNRHQKTNRILLDVMPPPSFSLE